jgi:hypothetical protein
VLQRQKGTVEERQDSGKEGGKRESRHEGTEDMADRKVKVVR